MISLSEEEHSKNSDWAWKIAADPEATMASSNSTRCRVSIDFGKEIIPEREYFTMDVKMTKDAGELMVRYLDRDGNRVLDRYFAEPKGEWFEITSEKTYGDVEIAGVMLIIMHPKEEKASVYDANNVSVLIDNCYLHVREGYVATKNKVVPASGKDGSAQLAVYGGSAARASYLQIEGNYTNECFEFTTTMTETGVYIGARLDKVTTKIQDSNGLVVLVRYNRMDYYVPKFNAEHKGAFRYWQYGVSNLEIGKDYTFTVWVVEGEKAGTNNLVVRIKDGDKVLAIFESDTCKDIRNDGDITKEVAKKGCFAVWSLDLSRKITYRMPYHSEIPKSVNKIISAQETEGGVAEISPAVPGKNRSAAYLKMDGNYTDEGFTFKTKVTENGFYVGARLNQVTQDVTDSAGILVYVRYNRIDYYTPVFDNEHKGAFRFWQYGMSNLEIGKEYTFTVWVPEGSTPGTNNLVIRVKDGDKVLGVFEHENCQDIRNGGNISSGVGKSGSFAVWSVDETRTIAYEMPADLEVPKTINKVVSALETEGSVAELSSAVQGTNRNASYLKMEGAYKNEGFTFTTKWTGADLYIGARLDQVTTDVTASNGIMILVRRDRIYYYSPKFDATMKGRINYGDYGMSALTEGKDYTFTVWVPEGTTAGTNNLVIQIKDGDKVLGIFDHETCKDVRDGGDLTTGVPANGSFAVWSIDAERTITYEIPATSVIPKTVNKIVPSTDTEGGTAELASAVQGSNRNASYLEMEGEYKNEGFTFTTTWTNTDLYIGARIEEASSDMAASNGIIILVRRDRIYYYSPKFDAEMRGRINYGDYGMSALTEGKDYTFTVWVPEGSTAGTNNLVIQIKDGDKIVGLFDHETCKDVRNGGDLTTGVPETGSFAVWSLDETRTIEYKIPVVSEIPKQVNKIVDSSETTGGTAELASAVEGANSNASYLQMQGAYANEGFTFTTKWNDTYLYVGARLDQVTSEVRDSSGVIMQIRKDRIVYYSPKFDAKQRGTILFNKYGMDTPLVNGKDYTFTVWVTEGSTPGKNNLIIQITDSNGVQNVLDHENCVDIRNDGDLNSGVPASGSFAVWSIDKERSITYEIPKQTVIPTQGISKSLTPAVASNHGNTGFTNVVGSYGAEGFEVTTKVTKDMSLYLGARMNSSRVTQDLYNARGIIIGIKHDRIYYYSPRWHSSENWREGYVKFASIGKSGLTPDKDYTFSVWVTDGSTSGTYNVVVQIKDGTNVHSVINFETQAVKETDKGGGSFLATDNIPATGSFAVWSIEQRQVKYRILHGVTAPAVQ